MKKLLLPVFTAILLLSPVVANAIEPIWGRWSGSLRDGDAKTQRISFDVTHARKIVNLRIGDYRQGAQWKDNRGHHDIDFHFSDPGDANGEFRFSVHGHFFQNNAYIGSENVTGYIYCSGDIRLDKNSHNKHNDANTFVVGWNSYKFDH